MCWCSGPPRIPSPVRNIRTTGAVLSLPHSRDVVPEARRTAGRLVVPEAGQTAEWEAGPGRGEAAARSDAAFGPAPAAGFRVDGRRRLSHSPTMSSGRTGTRCTGLPVAARIAATIA